MNISSQARIMAYNLGTGPRFHTVLAGDIGDLGIIYLRNSKNSQEPRGEKNPSGYFDIRVVRKKREEEENPSGYLEDEKGGFSRTSLLMTLSTKHKCL
jgi:hypothetical protein